jgi:hypothetical protein
MLVMNREVLFRIAINMALFVGILPVLPAGFNPAGIGRLEAYPK